MIEMSQQKVRPVLPFKSVAGALLFSVILGPIGLLYSSVIGGVILIILCMTAISGKFYVATAIFWITSCIVSVAAVNHYNKKIIKILTALN
jgi:hypothetical protein